MSSNCNRALPHKFKTIVLAGTALGLVASGGHASAQTTLAAAGADAVEEVVVTANKREQSLNDVGLAVSVVSAEALKAHQISNLANLAAALPGLSYSTTHGNTPVYTLRGVGFYETSLSAYPTATIYLDEVPLVFPIMSTHSTFDLERVEVLKGPQGTLFGQNATGGALNFIAAKPTDEFHAGATIGYGRFNRFDAEGYVSGPVARGVTARLAGRIERGDGWQISQTRPDDRNGELRNYMGRLLLNIEPSERLSFQINLNAWRDRSETQAAQFSGLVPQSPPTLNPPLATRPFAPDNNRVADWSPGFSYADNRLLQGSIRTDYSLTDSITITALTAYADFKEHQASDMDGVAEHNNDSAPIDGRVKTFFQELRASNGGNGRFRWVAGGNYERTKTFQNTIASFYEHSVSRALHSLGFVDFGRGDINPYIDSERLENYAGFVNGEFDAGDFTFKAGARYTEARRSSYTCNYDLQTSGLGVGGFFYLGLLGGALGPYVPGTCYVINNTPNTIGNVRPGTTGPFVTELNENNISYRVGVDWKPASGTLLYANVARGYKAGSVPSAGVSVMSQNKAVTQESVQAYEVGAKFSLLDRRADINLAAFYYDYSDKQIRGKVLDPVFGALDQLVNVPKSTIKGLEVEGTARPVTGLSARFNFTYLDAEIKEYSGINPSGLFQDFAGGRLPYTPKYQAGLDLDYTFQVSDNYTARIGGSYSYRSRAVATIGGEQNPVGVRPANRQAFGIKAYSTLDLRATIGPEDDRWTLGVWGKNVTNESYWNNVYLSGDTIIRYAGMPATYGVTFSVRR